MNNSQITGILQSIFASKHINNISDSTGLNKVDTKNIMLEALPKLLNGMNANLSDPKNTNALYDALDDHLGVDFSDGISLQEGQKILGHIFSNPNQISNQISSTTGANKTEALGVLSGLAPVLMSILGNQKANGAKTSDIAGLVSNLTNQANSGLMLNIFDKNHNGDVKDDIFSMIIGFFKNLFLGKKS